MEEEEEAEEGEEGKEEEEEQEEREDGVTGKRPMSALSCRSGERRGDGIVIEGWSKLWWATDIGAEEEEEEEEEAEAEAEKVRSNEERGERRGIKSVGQKI